VNDTLPAFCLLFTWLDRDNAYNAGLPRRTYVYGDASILLLAAPAACVLRASTAWGGYALLTDAHRAHHNARGTRSAAFRLGEFIRWVRYNAHHAAPTFLRA